MEGVGNVSSVFIGGERYFYSGIVSAIGFFDEDLYHKTL
jgi:hypothetical protein